MTVLPAAPSASLESVLNDSWKLLRRNWSLAVVPLVAWIVAGVVVAAIIACTAIAVGVSAVGRQMTPAQGLVLVAAWLACALVLGVGGAAITALTFGMADAAWETGSTSFAAGVATMRARLGPTLAAFLGLAGVGILAVILALPTLGLALLAMPVVVFYVLPAAIVGGTGGFAAIGESWRLMRRFFGITALAVLILLAIRYAVTFVAYVFIIPLQIGVSFAGNGHAAASIVALVVLAGLLCIASLVLVVALCAEFAFSTLATVGLYRWLRARAAAEDAAAAAGPPVPVGPAGAPPEPPLP